MFERGGLTRLLTIAGRDFRATVMSKAFVFGLAVPPLAGLAMAVLLPHALSSLTAGADGTVVVVEAGTDLSDALTSAIEARTRSEQQAKATAALEAVAGMSPPDAAPTPIRIETRVAAASAVEAELARLRAGEVLAVVAGAPTPDASAPPTPPTLYVDRTIGPGPAASLESLLTTATRRLRWEAAGFDAVIIEAAAADAAPVVRRVGGSGEIAEDDAMAQLQRELVPMGFMLLLFMGTFLSANQLLTSTIEEKSGKIMEVLLSAVSPFELLAGKILGQGAVGLLIAAVYGSAAIATLIGLALTEWVAWSDLVLFFLYYLMAYFTAAALMATIGSAVSELRDAQSLLAPVMVVLVAPLFLWLPISAQPDGALATVTSFVPPLIPYVMTLRIAASDSVPLWQIGGSLIVGYAATVGLAWVAARVFRVGVLMTGKPPSFLELLRWVRVR